MGKARRRSWSSPHPGGAGLEGEMIREAGSGWAEPQLRGGVACKPGGKIGGKSVSKICLHPKVSREDPWIPRTQVENLSENDNENLLYEVCFFRGSAGDGC